MHTGTNRLVIIGNSVGTHRQTHRRQMRNDADAYLTMMRLRRRWRGIHLTDVAKRQTRRWWRWAVVAPIPFTHTLPHPSQLQKVVVEEQKSTTDNKKMIQ